MAELSQHIAVTGQRVAGDRQTKGRYVTCFLAAALVLTAINSLGVGATGLPIWDIIGRYLTGAGLTHTETIVLFDIRMPRMLMGVLVGSALAVSGAIMQGLFRNPLADPGLIGVGSGAALGAIVAIVLGSYLPARIAMAIGPSLVPFAAFFGAWATTLLLYRVSTRGGRTSVAIMLLAGIAVGALSGAVSGVLIYIADDTQLRDLTFWGMGSLAGATWTKIAVAAPMILIALGAAPALARALNAMALGETSAMHMGINVQRMKRFAILAVAGATGAAVAISGGIGFIGIVVPHLLRISIGPDHRYLLPASALLGATILLIADMIARVAVAPSDLPIGIITAILGGPFFLFILLRNRGLLEA